MVLFLSAGIPRSGSTWLYNAMRLVLVKQFPAVYGCWVGDFDPSKAALADAVLVKIHKVDQVRANSAQVILTCHRDLRDIACSMQSMGWPFDVLERIRRCRSYHEFWATRAAADISYGNIISRPKETLREIASALGADIDDDALSDIARSLASIPNNRDEGAKHDAEFLTHVNHRNDGRDGRWRDQLDARLAAAIADEHEPWLAKMGYF